jgi:putative ABC transport system permease protein
MATPALRLKLVRGMSRLKGQIVTIALVLAGGIACFVSLRGTYLSLELAREAYYDRQRFADVFAHVERAPEEVVKKVEALPSVEVVESRIAEEVTVPIEGLSRPAYGRLLSLPSGRASGTNDLFLRKGRLPERGREDEAVVLEAFAEAHGFTTGARLPVVINGRLRDLRVVGIALSPEFVFAIRPGALADDPKRYAVLWMDRATLAAAFRLEGAFNDLTLRLQPGASEKQVRYALDRMLIRYGGDGAVGRDGQISNRILVQELSQLRALAGMVPLVFLGVAAFLINLVLARLVRLERPEIATLKAVGYSNRQIALHYLGLVTAVVVPGVLIGLGAGFLLGRRVLSLYGKSFRFPELSFDMSASLVVSAIVVTVLAAVGGALGAVRGAVKLPPAEAMRPPSPALYRRGIVERLRLAAFLGPSGMMVVREILRRPWRTLMSSAGMAGAIALLILSRFGWDSITTYFEGTFRREQRQDLTVAFARPVDPRVVGQLARMPGVTMAEGLRTVPIRVRHEHRMRDSVLMGLADDATLRRLITRGGGREVEVPPDGVLLTKTLGEILGLNVGDRPLIEVREGARRVVSPVIAGFVDESIGLQVYGRAELVASLEGDTGAVSSVLLKIDRPQRAAVEGELKRSPHVIDVSDVTADMERLFDMNASIMNVWTAISVVLSACVVFGVVYNNARINLAARSRDLASLRVLGFSRGEISSILLSGLAFEVLLALPAGVVLGKYWAQGFMNTVDQETFRWQVFVAPRTYLLSMAVATLAAAASALWVRRSLDHLDLISVLKSRE